MAICSNCGETAGPGRSYCPSCGAELPEEGDEPAEPREQHGNGESDRSQPDRESHNGAGEDDQRGRRESPGSDGQSGTGRGGRGSTPRDRSRGDASRDASSQPNRDAHSGGSAERDTPEPRQPRRSQQSGGQSRASGNRGGAGSGGSLLGTSGQAPSEPDVNDILWTIGWSPIKTIGGFAVLFIVLAVGMEMDSNGIGGMTFVGLVIGTVVWYLGVREVNEHYAAFRDAFFARSADRAESRLGIDRSEVIDAFNFRSHRGGSPFLVEPSNYYLADHMVLSDVSVSVDQNSQYDMENRGADSDGTTKNIYYDNIESITTNDEGALTNLRIVTSRGENLAVNTVDQRVAEEAQGRLRSKMRDVRRARR